jgi:transposase
MGAPTKYSEKLRDRAARKDPAASRGAIRRIAE